MVKVKHRLFGELAEAAGYITEDQLDEALEEQKRTRMDGETVPLLGEILRRRGYMNERQVQNVLNAARRLGGRRFGEMAMNLNLITIQQLDAARSVQRKLEHPEREVDWEESTRAVYESLREEQDNKDDPPILGRILKKLGFLSQEQVQNILDRLSGFVGNCPHCGTGIEMDSNPVGEQIRCTRCNRPIQVSRSSSDTIFMEPVSDRDPSDSDSVSVDQLRKTETEEYQFLDVIGRDEMGVTYRGKRKKNDQNVVLKVLYPRRVEDPRAMSFLKERVQEVQKLSDPAIRRVMGFKKHQNLHFLVLEWVEGDSLRNLLDRMTTLDPMFVLKVARCLVSALRKGAARNIFHGDIRPSHILLSEDDEVKLTKFGLAQEPSEHLFMFTRGTDEAPFYMSPELIVDKRMMNRRADIYSLGACLYHMVTGEPPFTGCSPYTVVRTAFKEGIQPPHIVNPDVSRGLSRLINKMVAVEPKDRFEDYLELKNALDSSNLLNRGGSRNVSSSRPGRRSGRKRNSSGGPGPPRRR